MELMKAILKEHSKNQSIRIVNYIGNNAKRFSELVSIFLAGPYRITQLAAWPLILCVEQNPKLIRPHLKKIMTHLEQPNVHDAVKRNAVRLLQYVVIPKNLQGHVANVCFRFLQNTKEPIAVRVFAMTVLANLAKELPELKNELVPVIEDQLPFGSAGFVSRGQRVLKELKG